MYDIVNSLIGKKEGVKKTGKYQIKNGKIVNFDPSQSSAKNDI